MDVHTRVDGPRGVFVARQKMLLRTMTAVRPPPAMLFVRRYWGERIHGSSWQRRIPLSWALLAIHFGG